MKKTAILLLLASCLALNGCCCFGLGDLDLSDLVELPLPSQGTADLRPDMGLQPYNPAPATAPGLPTEATEPEAVTLPPETEPEQTQTPETLPPETEAVGTAVELDRNGQYTINIFLSNFAEVGMQAYGTAAWELLPRTQQTKRLVDFVHIHYKINSDNVLYNSKSDYGESLSLKEINDKLKRYIGVTVTMEQIEDAGYIVENGRVHWWAGAGESYAEFAVADKLTELEDGTYLAEFTVYTATEHNSGGDTVASEKSYYYYTPEKAEADSSVEFCYRGTALVESYRYNGKNTYRLIAYDPDLG